MCRLNSIDFAYLLFLAYLTLNDTLYIFHIALLGQFQCMFSGSRCRSRCSFLSGGLSDEVISIIDTNAPGLWQWLHACHNHPSLIDYSRMYSKAHPISRSRASLNQHADGGGNDTDFTTAVEQYTVSQLSGNNNDQNDTYYYDVVRAHTTSQLVYWCGWVTLCVLCLPLTCFMIILVMAMRNNRVNLRRGPKGMKQKQSMNNKSK